MLHILSKLFANTTRNGYLWMKYGKRCQSYYGNLEIHNILQRCAYNIRESILVGIGNPLLDITIQGDTSLLERYNLQANNAVIAEPSQLPLYNEIVEKYDPEYTAGGSTQNSLRVCQWILKKPHICAFMGSVGIDNYSEILQKKAEEDGVNVRYQYQKDTPTGTCAVVVTKDSKGHHRSLCANLAAANCFTIDHIMLPNNRELIMKADYIYIGGFFHTVSPTTIKELAQIAHNNNKILLTNLSAQFICQFFNESLMQLMPYVDVLFGNETEAEALATVLDFGITDLREIALRISKLPKVNNTRNRIVVITQGHLPVILVKDNALTEVSVPIIKEDDIVDTNGAGDAFVGGFLSQFILQKTLDDCVKCGIWAASHIIKHSGCSFDTKLSYSV